MTNEEAREVLGDVRAYLASRASLENEMLADHTFTDICNAIKALEQQPCEDCISREAVMKCFKKWQPYMATRLWDYEQELKELPSVTPKYTDEEIDKAQLVEQAYVDKMVELAVKELKTPKAEWKDIYAESEGPNSWIEFTCPHCGNAFGIESGQYGWSYGDAIPWKACPMCGGLAEHEPYKVESEE